MVITIDDGYRSTYEVAFPVLKRHSFPATVFLYSDFVGAGDALTWAQMKEMTQSGLIDIQPHSKSHANLTLKLAGRERTRATGSASGARSRRRSTRSASAWANRR